jgi:hypothetical protein
MRYTISTIIYSILHSSHGFLSFQKEEEEENVHLLWLMDSSDNRFQADFWMKRKRQSIILKDKESMEPDDSNSGSQHHLQAVSSRDFFNSCSLHHSLNPRR